MSIFRTRRTIKPVDMDPSKEIPRPLLEELLEDAIWAPTHGLTQPWRFHIFDTPESRRRLADALVGIYEATTPEGQRDSGKRAKLDVGPRRAPVVIALLARVLPGGKIPEWEEIAAASCAAQNLMLSAQEKGLGSFWSSPPVACSAEFASWLGAETKDRPLGLIYLGWPLPGAPIPVSTREPLAERVVWHGQAGTLNKPKKSQDRGAAGAAKPRSPHPGPLPGRGEGDPWHHIGEGNGADQSATSDAPNQTITTVSRRKALYPGWGEVWVRGEG
jgi:nitroreductase